MHNNNNNNNNITIHLISSQQTAGEGTQSSLKPSFSYLASCIHALDFFVSW